MNAPTRSRVRVRVPKTFRSRELFSQVTLKVIRYRKGEENVAKIGRDSLSIGRVSEKIN